MGKKVYFLDSVKQSDGSYDNTYGVDDVNAIVSNLVGAGVAPFPSGDTYDVSELNSLTSALVAEGTSLDGLKVSFANNKIHIAQGIGYFENGATIVVDADGEELDYNVAETLYVYAEYNQALNTCGFYASESKPTSSTGIYVLILATIAADGVVTDKRVIAQSKIATLGRNECKEYVIATHEGDVNGDQYYSDLGKDLIVWEQEIDISRFNLIYTAYKMNVTGSSSNGYGSERMIKITDGSIPSTSIFFKSPSTSYLDYSLKIRYANGKLQIYVSASTSNQNYAALIYELRLEIY